MFLTIEKQVMEDIFGSFFQGEQPSKLKWLNELGCWIQQLIQAYHQYSVGSLTAL
jgi:hypothetical protein